jgi:hypothetical protein
MIPHIFKKDVRLLWRMALGVALVNALRTVLSPMSHNTLSRNLPVEKLASTFMSVAALATGLLIVMVVQTDALAGLRQDWLARPIKRADLVFSKLLFIVLLVQLPIFIADVCQGLAAGLPVGAVIGAAASRSVYLFLALDLPVFAFATLTRNLMEALGAALAVALAVGLIMVAAPAATSSSGIGWIADTMQLACELAGVALVAGLQYYRRRTARSWWITGSVVAVAMATQLLPWQQAFAVQERLSTAPSETLPVHIQLDNPSNRMFLGSAREGQAMVMVPLTLIGVAADEKLIEDRATARLVGSEGVFAEPTTGYDQGRALGLPFSQYLRLEFPAGLVGRLRRQPSRLEVDYSLTLERAVEHASLPVEAAPELVPGLGRCATGTNFAASAVELH